MDQFCIPHFWTILGFGFVMGIVFGALIKVAWLAQISFTAGHHVFREEVVHELTAVLNDPADLRFMGAA